MSSEVDWFKSVKDSILNKFKDISNIEVVTAVADDVSTNGTQLTSMENLKNIQLNKMTYYARTTMQLDGDNYTLLPSGADKDRVQKVTELHEDHVKTAVLNWNNMARVAFTGFLIVGKMTDQLKKEEIKEFSDLISKFGIISKVD